MSRRARATARAKPKSTNADGRLLLAAAILTPLVAVLLSLPGFRNTWAMDDFDFLARAQAFRPSFLLPDSGSFFYRPISREIYFGGLTILGRGDVIVGHAMNAVLLAACVALLVSVDTRLMGPKAGILGGLCFAALGAAPLLVGWVSGAQDLLAIAFSLLALRFQLSERPVPAAAAMAGALLSKEASMAFLPVLALLPWILRRSPRRATTQILPYATLVLTWALIHPALRLVGSEQAAGKGQYLGLGSPWQSVGHTLLALANLPLASPPWPSALTAPCVLAISLVLAASWLIARSGPSDRVDRYPNGCIILLSGLILILSIVMTSALVRFWAPYYAVIPAVGSSLLLGRLLSRLAPAWGGVAVSAFLALGVWSRGANPEPVILCEPYLKSVSSALLRVEAGFKILHPSFPPGAHAIVSVSGTGSQGIWTHMHRYQALRVWYRDPSLLTLLPERRRAGNHPELLFRITPELDVVEIDPDRCLFRSSGGMPDPDQVGRTIRTYARGVAATGETDRATRILVRLAEFDGGLIRDYDLRLAAMIRLFEGKMADAESLIASTPKLPRGFALDMVGKVFAEPSRSAAIDSFAFRAFELSPSDTSVVGHLMRIYRDSGYRIQALEFARRLQQLVPGDPASAALIREGAAWKPGTRITSPPGIDSL